MIYIRSLLHIILLLIFYNNINYVYGHFGNSVKTSSKLYVTQKEKIMIKFKKYKYKNKCHLYKIYTNKTSYLNNIKFYDKNIKTNKYIYNFIIISKYNTINNNFDKIIKTKIGINKYYILKKLNNKLNKILYSKHIYKYHHNDINKKLYNIQNKLFVYETKTAKFYFKNNNYISSLNRSRIILKTFNQNILYWQALKIIINSYSAIGDNKKAKKLLFLFTRINHV